MGQKILVAVDDSENAARTVAFITRSISRDSSITLFSVLPDTATLCDMNSPELTPHFKAQQSNFCLLEDEKKVLIESALKNARGMLLQAGFAEDDITTEVSVKKAGIAKDIVEKAKDGFDLIVIGRRGVSSIKDYFLGSISHKVLHLAHEVSVLIIS